MPVLPSEPSSGAEMVTAWLGVPRRSDFCPELISPSCEMCILFSGPTLSRSVTGLGESAWLSMKQNCERCLLGWTWRERNACVRVASMLGRLLLLVSLHRSHPTVVPRVGVQRKYPTLLLDRMVGGCVLPPVMLGGSTARMATSFFWNSNPEVLYIGRINWRWHITGSCLG